MDGYVINMVTQGLSTAMQKTVGMAMTMDNETNVGHLSEDNGSIILAL